MQKPTLTVFANFRIDTEERLLRMKDSFLSFRMIDAKKWVVNIRGEYKVEARNFLETYLDSELIMFQLESPEGWFYDSRIMSSEIESEYVFIWVEDHICLQFAKIAPTLDEMQEKAIDVLTYSFCHKDQARAYYGNNDIVSGTELDWFEHTALNNQIIQQNMNGGVRLVACISILKNALFRKVLSENKKFIWPKETPFDFEVAPTELQFLPLKRAIPKHELFASIDDDNAVPNTCLISRGLYPERIPGPRMTATSSLQNCENPQTAKNDSFKTSDEAPDQNKMIMLINGYRVDSPVLPTGIGYVAQALEDAGIDYEVCDVNLHSHDQILEWIKIIRPSHVGLGTMTFEVEKNYELLQAIKTEIPDSLIILGGPHAIAAGKDIFKECSAVDMVIQGEGEVSIVKVLRGEPLHNIPGAMSGHAPHPSTPHEPLDITRIAFPRYHKFALEKYGSVMNIASSRGCVYKCSFCGGPRFLGKKWRAFSTDRMIEEFGYWYGKGYRNFYFTDSLFVLDKQRVMDFCAHIIDAGYNDVTFTADGVRADHLTLEVLQHMKKAHFTSLILGVESVNDNTLDFFKKGETFNQIDKAVSMADALGFLITVYLIIGAPGESYADALKSIYYPLRYKNIVHSIVSKLMPIKGTPYYEYALEHNLVANPDLCYPVHEAANFNTRNDSQNPVEDIWQALYPEIEKVSRFLEIRNKIKSNLFHQGIQQTDVNAINKLTLEYLSPIYGDVEYMLNSTYRNQTRSNQTHNSEELIKRLRAVNIPVVKMDLSVEQFVSWLKEHREIHRRSFDMKDVVVEKCLEYYVAFKLGGLKPGYTYIDVAAAGSHWSDILRNQGIDAYSLDLIYPQGIHGHRIGADAVKTGLPANCVDVMSLQCAFETFRGDSDRLFLKEAGRILKHGGKVIISPLYIDDRHFILSAKNADTTKAPLDEGSVRVWREDQYGEAFSRHYSPEALADRIFSNLCGLSAQIIYINNLEQFRNRFPGQRIYCDFILWINKPRKAMPAADANKLGPNQSFPDNHKDLSPESTVIMNSEITKSDTDGRQSAYRGVIT